MRRVCFLGLVVLLGATPLLACKLPVFRYALERWGVDQYRLVALVSDPDAEGVSEALEALKGVQADQLNAAVEIVNLSELTDEQWWQFEGLEGAKESPPSLFSSRKSQRPIRLDRRFER